MSQLHKYIVIWNALCMLESKQAVQMWQYASSLFLSCVH